MSEHTARFDAIGTRWVLKVADDMPDAEWGKLYSNIQTRITEFDKNYSRFRDDSLVAQITRNAGSYDLPPDALPLLQFYEQLYKVTEGKVTPLIGQTMVEAGYDASYSFHKETMHAPPAWEEVLSYDQHHVEVKQPVLLDFGAAGKGYLLDIIGGLLQEAGYQSYVIDAGGDILQCSETNMLIAVGLENPLDASEAIGIVRFSNQSLCASSGSKRKWQDIHHIINPVTLQPTSSVVATWALADDAMTADGLATALFFTSPDELKKQFNFTYAVLDQSMNLQYDKNFPVELFKDN